MRAISTLGVIVATVIVMSAQGARAASPCTTDMKGCQVVTSPNFQLNGLETKGFDLRCPAAAPFYRAWSAEKDHSAVVVYPWLAVETNRGIFTATNWDVTPHHLYVEIACSTSPQADTCFLNLDCPLVDGTSELVCPDENCWSQWDEQCADGSYYNCSTMTFVPCCFLKQ
jgi:hypothetical protein